MIVIKNICYGFNLIAYVQNICFVSRDEELSLRYLKHNISVQKSCLLCVVEFSDNVRAHVIPFTVCCRKKIKNKIKMYSECNTKEFQRNKTVP